MKRQYFCDAYTSKMLFKLTATLANISKHYNNIRLLSIIQFQFLLGVTF